MTEIYLNIVARMADYMDTHPYFEAFVDSEYGGSRDIRSIDRDRFPPSPSPIYSCTAVAVL